MLDAKIPVGPIQDKWTRHKFNLKLVNPANKRKFEVIVVGGGHAGAEAALASARMGLRTACVVLDPSAIGRMSCNPAIGGLEVAGPSQYILRTRGRESMRGAGQG